MFEAGDNAADGSVDIVQERDGNITGRKQPPSFEDRGSKVSKHVSRRIRLERRAGRQ